MRWKHLTAVIGLTAALAGCGKRVHTTQDELDRRFEQMMSGATLEGSSARLSDGKVSGPEKYVIQKVSKLAGETWLFQARFQYGSHDIPIPIPVTIKWAGDTPVITVTELTIPGMGSYTARVVLYGGQYAGTWSGKGHGGQLFGRIVRRR